MHGRTISFLCGVSFVAFGAFAIADSSRQTPDDLLTPGVIAADGHDTATVCATTNGLTYSKRHRATPAELKTAIRQRDHSTGAGEVDHRVPLCLGGADVESNLWWQQDFKHKDELEAWACRAVCHEHTIGLDAAQEMFIAPADWRDAYKEIFGRAP